jgi:predicted GH43/DUF377 family glycosyl hydrolase
MKWKKQGLIFAPDGSKPWMKTHGFPPTPLRMGEDRLRLYVAFCDAQMVGRIGYVDVDAAQPSKVLAVSDKPILDIGTPGAFDENGLLPTCVLKVGEEVRMYYVGYQLGHKVRYFQFEGLATSKDGGESFHRYSKTPVLERSDQELLNRTSAFVMQDEGVYKMWYVGGSQWTDVQGKSLPVYNIRYIVSKDGLSWGSEGEVCIDFSSEDEHAFGRPWVLKENGSFKMFYSVRTRSKGYRLGYAESTNGIRWTRKDDEVGITVSKSGWDSEMIAYASIVKHGGRTFMFYNGNKLGASGFGYAILE